ncbi:MULTISPECIES: sensor histidine kinase [unclassified Sphingomonas]|uniref:sensor histidine kinase n=1 Tax=unclassified Sphingomonas TaxID=196159 RepID=UPI00215072AD|nr:MULTISPECIES: HAMP domain-containing sensor histidine kinase [unclassified Sphingomonas]MCR5869662.1 HAMP domain-containing histidine kinase [Sphingomonas sp. J344]UUX98626.1 HAMP domain-containing histidine kinase [Sphingomonas sp. J315]
MRRFVPSSLTGQIALLVALALFVAQAINFGLILRERRSLRFEQVTAPAITRVVDAAERIRDGRFRDHPDGRRARLRIEPSNPIPPGLRSKPEVEEGIRLSLAEAGIPVGQIVTGVRRLSATDPRFARMNALRAERMKRLGGELIVAVELPGKGWLVLTSAWPRSDGDIIWRLILQTLIIYAVVLVPVLWVGHRVARPLRSLAVSAREFHPASPGDPIEERGPGDVRAVIAAYNLMRDRVTAMLDEKDQMLGAIGHDLRTPLAALRVRIESVEDEEDRARMADTIDEMNRTLDDILSLARLGRPSEPPTETDLSALIDAVVDDFRDLGAPVEYEDGHRLIRRIRPSLMRRAVRNLIENAVKYGGGAEVKLIQDASGVRIEVGDRGPGIPEEQIAAVFDPFTRLDPSRNRTTGGVGLGLTLARAIVREAGGDITLANREGGGLCATITLPGR